MLIKFFEYNVLFIYYLIAVMTIQEGRELYVYKNREDMKKGNKVAIW